MTHRGVHLSDKTNIVAHINDMAHTDVHLSDMTHIDVHRQTQRCTSMTK